MNQIKRSLFSEYIYNFMVVLNLTFLRRKILIATKYSIKQVLTSYYLIQLTSNAKIENYYITLTAA